ncbi:lauroyl-Kdo(2)-lipid IV(A) myristoyltransferase [Vibrio sp. CAU 1672]|uniref:lauroyl-Kdo(2)-lipid IV(A) myristoyltransferase n=1 Tax=Vibrio sp. CAU 1672 TaxID=3032594 RepID=UPI0023DA408C|nr:lauroyl-Kdo(2)-lipid IV(A) myristoyltransferase [Vibrio sp. CAU 1672]MDF2153913.1 lauroyl-Kdo(2)-lipid IV(A) myristoyltransferase [Vibrio sp. CAU 1672]
MTTQRDDYDPKAYQPKFKREFLAPKHWGTWLGVILFLPVTLLPLKLQKWLAQLIAAKMAKSHTGPAHRSRVNFELCFPEKSFAEREKLIEKTLFTATLFFLRFGLLSLRSSQWLRKRCKIKGMEILQQYVDKHENVILLTPHTWAIDVPAILLASMGMPVTGFAKKQKNEVADWLMHRQRIQYGGRIYERSVGIKPYLKAIREGYIGYYLPDQDHGPEGSVFVDFFATRKATLPGLGKLAKLTKSTVLPLFVALNPDNGDFEIEILPALEVGQGEEQDARTCNRTIEHFVGAQPEQYMWVLQLLHSQEDGNNYYNLFKPRYNTDWRIEK